MNYQGKPIAEYFTSDLEKILASFKEAEDKREQASKHKKFEKMEFPPPNPIFVELKSAIEEEIAKRKQVNSNA